MSLSSELTAALKKEHEEICSFDFPLSRRTTLKIGGPAEVLIAPKTTDEVVQIVQLALQHGAPIFALGGGSNLLVRDGGIAGVVLCSRQYRGIEVDGKTITVESGASTGKVLKMAMKHSLGGVEFLGGVPGTIGGGMIMNAGTYLGEFKDVTTWVETIDLMTGKLGKRTNEQCGFVYRGSDIPRSEFVLRARLDLEPRDLEDIKKDVAGLRQRRKEREPSGVHNSGSTFKNPEGDYAGRLIETAGCKGMRVGKAECSPKHANWLVNTGGATAKDMIQLIEQVRTKVLEFHGVKLVLEVKVVGND